MSNRELQGRKLKPHQRRIWTDAFKASMSHVSIEAAERKAWQAVDICERVGAFHESVAPTVEPDRSFDAFGTLRRLLGDYRDAKIDAYSLYRIVASFDEQTITEQSFVSVLVKLLEESKQQSIESDKNFAYKEAWEYLVEWFEKDEENYGKFDALHSALIDFCDGETNAEQFKTAIFSIDESNWPTPTIDAYRKIWKTLALLIADNTAHEGTKFHSLCTTMNDFALGKISFEKCEVEFRTILVRD